MSSIQFLRIEGAVLTTDDLTAILSHLYSLTHLTLDNVRFDPSEFHYQKFHNLEVLELLRLPPYFEFEYLFWMSKTNQPSLKRLDLSYLPCHFPDEDEVRSFELRNQIEVNIYPLLDYYEDDV